MANNLVEIDYQNDCYDQAEDHQQKIHIDSQVAEDQSIKNIYTLNSNKKRDSFKNLLPN